MMRLSIRRGSPCTTRQRRPSSFAAAAGEAGCAEAGAALGGRDAGPAARELQYMFKLHEAGRNITCLAVNAGGDLTIIGNYQQQNLHVLYDLANSLLSFVVLYRSGKRMLMSPFLKITGQLSSSYIVQCQNSYPACQSDRKRKKNRPHALTRLSPFSMSGATYKLELVTVMKLSFTFEEFESTAENNLHFRFY